MRALAKFVTLTAFGLFAGPAAFAAVTPAPPPKPAPTAPALPSAGASGMTQMTTGANLPAGAYTLFIWGTKCENVLLSTPFAWYRPHTDAGRNPLGATRANDVSVTRNGNQIQFVFDGGAEGFFNMTGTIDAKGNVTMSGNDGQPGWPYTIALTGHLNTTGVWAAGQADIAFCNGRRDNPAIGDIPANGGGFVLARKDGGDTDRLLTTLFQMADYTMPQLQR